MLNPQCVQGIMINVEDTVMKSMFLPLQEGERGGDQLMSIDYDSGPVLVPLSANLMSLTQECSEVGVIAPILQMELHWEDWVLCPRTRSL